MFVYVYVIFGFCVCSQIMKEENTGAGAEAKR